MVINYIREQVELGLVDIRKIDGDDNIADALTKPLRDGKFEKHIPRILGEPSTPSEDK
jgi:hypothetical protein